MINWFKNKILSSNKNTLFLIGSVLFSLLFIYQIVLVCYGNYFSANSDDVLQYSPILLQYIDYFKEGKLTWYNFTNSFGTSVFADVYYVPLDIFTVLTFILSYIVDGVLASSIASLSKILLGTIIFAYFLQRKKFNNKIVLILSLMYFSTCGIWSFVTYSTYFSLFFYLPLSLLMVDVYSKEKKWLLPLYSFVLVLYNFYNAYALFIFMMFTFIVVKIRDNYSGVVNLLKTSISFGLHIVLGVCMGMFILVPSILYIINYSVRNTEQFQLVFDLEVYFRMIYKLFVLDKGVMAFSFGEKSYIQYHFSIYIGFMGLFLLSLLFTMKDRVSKIYKRVLCGVGVMMVIPIFSMIFSGVAIAYNRWLSYLNIILIYFIGHVLTNLDKKSIDYKKSLKVGIVIWGLYLLCVLINIFIINKYSSDYILYSVYVQSLLILILFGAVMTLYTIFYLVKKYDLVYGVFALEMIMAIAINLSVGFDGKLLKEFKTIANENAFLNDLDFNSEELFRIYLDGKNGYNDNRKYDYLVNEVSYHSFMSKYIYEHKALYSDKEFSWTIDDLTRYNPNNSRVMDYKYLILKKENYNYTFDYLDVFYEDEKYIVYENEYYNPFYVYESYYDEKDVISYNDYNNYLQFEKNLFRGVILEDGVYNLAKIRYEENDINRLNIFQSADLKEINLNEYEMDLSDYGKYGYKGRVYLKSSQIGNIVEINIMNGEQLSKCEQKTGFYSCAFDGIIDKIVIKTNSNILDVRYGVEVDIDDSSEYALVLLNKENYNYMHYYQGGTNEIILKEGNNKEMICLQGLCPIKDINFDHLLIEGKIINNEEEKYIDYYFDNLEYYNANKVDILASNKSLTYNNSKIHVTYTRDSLSDYDQIVVLPVTYSDEWVVDNADYKLIKVNGGFLGIQVKQGIKDIDICIRFKPSGVKMGFIGTIIGFCIYGCYIGVIFYKKKKGHKNEIV